jgi:hypothetical protein
MTDANEFARPRTEALERELGDDIRLTDVDYLDRSYGPRLIVTHNFLIRPQVASA